MERQSNELEVLHLRGISIISSKRGYTVIIGAHHKTYHSDLESAVETVFEHYVKVKASESTMKSVADLISTIKACKAELITECRKMEVLK